MQLLPVDLVALNNSDLQQNRLHFDEPGVVPDSGSIGRLLRAEMMKTDGTLTKAGLALLQKVKKTEKRLQKGIPFEKRMVADPMKIFGNLDYKWKTGMVSRKNVFTNGEVIIIGTIERKFKAEKGAIELRKKLPLIIARSLKASFEEVWPHTFQIEKLGGVELVWLANAGQERYEAIQAQYYDYLRDKFPTGKWFAESPRMPLQVRVKNRGLRDGVVALVMPLLMEGWPWMPVKREEWGSGKKKV